MKDAAKSYLVQDGWTKEGRRIMREHTDIFAVNGMPCKYKNEHPDDEACRGCRHRQDSMESGGGGAQ
jgi:hypothetical protein